jgi:glutamate transport system permease protein
VAEPALMMRNMFEFNISLLYWIFAIMAFGFLVLTLPVGLFFTWWSRKLAVQR